MSNRVTNLDDVYDSPSFQKVDVAWKHIKDSAYNFTTDVDYQRDHVWTQEHRENFVGFVLSGGESPPLWANVRTIDRECTEILDGKQRMTSAIMWLDGEICGRLPDGREVWYADLNEVSKRLMNIHVSFEIRLVDLPRNKVLELYLKLNSAGVVHTEEELERVRQLLDQENN